MSLRTAYTALLTQFPAVSVGIVAALAAFLGAALPGVGLARLGTRTAVVDGGLRWGGTIGASAAFGIGLGVLLLLRRGEAGPRARTQAALALLLAAPAGMIAAWAGAAVGGLAVGLPWSELGAALVARWALPWPVAVAAAAMAAATWGTAKL